MRPAMPASLAGHPFQPLQALGKFGGLICLHVAIDQFADLGGVGGSFSSTALPGVVFGYGLDWHSVATLATWGMTLVIQRAEHRDMQSWTNS